MKRGIFFAFLCASIVGITAFALVYASFVRPHTFRSLFIGQKNTGARENRDYTNTNADIVEQANHGVVTVISLRALKSGEKLTGAPGEGNVQRGTGTGIVIDQEGFIVTNEHVIKDAERIRVKLEDGRDLNAVVKGSDHATDLALLKIEADNLWPLEFGDSDNVRVGDPVIAIGNPVEYERTVTAGIVSAK